MVPIDLQRRYTTRLEQPRSFDVSSDLSQALQCAFKARATEIRGRDALVEHCDVSIQDQPDNSECRLIVKTFYKHGQTFDAES